MSILTENAIIALKKIASEPTDEQDDILIECLLRILGFKSAVVAHGIATLDSKRSISIKEVAKVILEKENEQRTPNYKLPAREC